MNIHAVVFYKARNRMRRENDVKNNQAGGVDPLCGFCGLLDVYRIFGAISGIAQKSIHLTFVLAILFIGLYRQNETHRAAQVLDLFLLVAGCTVTVYITTLSRELSIDNTTHTAAMSVFGVLFIAVCWWPGGGR